MRCQLSIVDLPGGWTGRPQQGHRGGPRPSGCSYDQNVPAPDNLPTGPIGCSVSNAAGGQAASLQQRWGRMTCRCSPGSTHKRHGDRAVRQRHVDQHESRHDRVDRHDENPLIASRRTARSPRVHVADQRLRLQRHDSERHNQVGGRVKSPTDTKINPAPAGRPGQAARAGSHDRDEGQTSGPWRPWPGGHVGPVRQSGHWIFPGTAAHRSANPSDLALVCLLGLLPLRSSKPPRSERFAAVLARTDQQVDTRLRRPPKQINRRLRDVNA